MRFLINATHDIRSPLTLILGPLQKLKERTQDADNRQYIDTIDRNAQRLLLLVNQILDERRIDKNQMRLHCRETDLVKTIGGICSMYQYNAHQRGITFAFDHADPEVRVWVDRQNFEKVLSNLLSNAFKYTPDGGEIRYSVSHDDRQAVIRLVDSGVGFKDEHTERLFDRFYQGATPRSYRWRARASDSTSAAPSSSCTAAPSRPTTAPTVVRAPVWR
jgi:signal transduction histidine kinase